MSHLLTTGWGTLVFFDQDEYDMPEEDDHPIGTIRKLQPQWRISHQFKPRSYENGSTDPIPVSLRVTFRKKLLLTIEIPFPNMRVKFGLKAAPLVCQAPAPPPGAWSKIEVAHKRIEQEDNQETQDIQENQDKKDKYILVLTVDDQDMSSMEVDLKTLRNLTDVKIFIGPREHEVWADFPDGYIQKVIVLDKP